MGIIMIGSQIMIKGGAYNDAKPNNAGYIAQGTRFVPDHVAPRTLTLDTREAILDHDRFLLALRRQNFGEAWRMGLENEQGDMWREIAEIDARSAIEKLTKQSIVENNPLKLNQAIGIKNQFNELPIYGELEALITEVRRSAEHLLGQYSESEGAAEAETRALRNLTLRLFGE